LLVLRYLDVYFEEGREAAQSAMNMRSFRRQLAVCGDNVFGRVLKAVVAMIDQPRGTYNSVFGPMAAYARLLEDFGEVVLANDVWDSLVTAVTRSGALNAKDSDEVVFLAFQRRAWTGHRLGRPSQAIADYARAFEYAEAHGLEKSMSWAAIGSCAVHAAGGAHGLALQVLALQMDKAEKHGWDELYAAAAMNRGHVYSLMKCPQEALLDFSLAIHTRVVLRNYESLVMNVAACAAECGYFELAKDAHELTLTSARNAMAKILAAVNLVELSVWTNNRSDFDRFSDLAEKMSLDARSRAYLYLYRVRGRISFGIANEPLAEVKQTLEAASALGIAPIVDQIGQDIRRFEMGGSLLPPTPKTVPLPLAMRLLHKHLRARLKESVA